MRTKKQYDDYGREIAPVPEKKTRRRKIENVKKEWKKIRRISHGIVLSCDIKKTFLDMPNPEHNNGMAIRAVVWSTSLRATLEKRKYWVRKDGEKINRQICSLTADDVRFIADHADEIIDVLEKADAEIVAKNERGIAKQQALQEKAEQNNV